MTITSRRRDSPSCSSARPPRPGPGHRRELFRRGPDRHGAIAGSLPAEADLRQPPLDLPDVANGNRAIDVAPGEPGAIGTECGVRGDAPSPEGHEEGTILAAEKGGLRHVSIVAIQPRREVVPGSWAKTMETWRRPP